MSKLSWIIFSAITIGFLAYLVVFSNNNKIDVSGNNHLTVQIASDQNGNIADHVYGKIDSKVTLIEYSDFQCPACGSIHPLVKTILEEYKDQIQFIFRNFPIASSHPNARAAAATAEAAGLQGKYWEMNNKIFETQYDWSNLSSTERTSFFANYAKDLGLDVEKFNTDVASTIVNEKINYDYAIGKKAGVAFTPSFYLNGTLLGQNSLGDLEKIRSAINSELTKANIPLPVINK